MRQVLRTRRRVSLLLTAIVLSGGSLARAQDGPAPTPFRADTFPEARPASLVQPFLDVIGDVKRLPSSGNLRWLTVGLAAAAAARPADHRLAATFSNSSIQSNKTFGAGAVLGGTPLELGTAFAAYSIARATHSPRAVALTSDLIRAQVLAELMTIGVKETVRRSRPDGAGFSFSSGHTAVTFASATVLQRHLGWRVGIPAYAVAGYVAASRVQMRRHYLSDVVFGAAVGMAAGRTVTMGRGFVVEPMVVSGGGGAAFTWNPRR